MVHYCIFIYSDLIISFVCQQTDPDKVNKKLLSKLTLRRKTSPKKAQPSTSKDESSPANTTIENSFCHLLEERKQIEVVSASL